MIEKDDLKSFISDIDKIISGKRIISSDYEYSDEEYKELLILSQLLAKADFSAEIPERLKRIWADYCNNDQMEDDELDMVAGGVNPNALPDGKDKKVF